MQLFKGMLCRNSLSLSLFFSRIIHAMCRRTCRILLIGLFLSYFFVVFAKADTATATTNTFISNTSTARNTTTTTGDFVVALGHNHHHAPVNNINKSIDKISISLLQHCVNFVKWHNSLCFVRNEQEKNSLYSFCFLWIYVYILYFSHV